MQLFRRLWDSPRLIPVLSVMTVLALASAAYAVFGVLAVDQQQERDRVASDLAACERGNDGRRSDIRIARATEDMVQQIIDTVLPAGASDRVDTIRMELEPVFVRHRQAVARIEIIRCAEVVPGGSPTTTEAPS